MMIAIRASGRRTFPTCCSHSRHRKPVVITVRTFIRFSRAQQQEKHSSFPRDPGLLFTSVLSDPKEVPGPQGIPSRSDQVKNLQNGKEYDVLVVGGGATGAGVALDAATRGLSVACLERGDFASETSSRSTKLIWAGLKYMGTATASLMSPQLFYKPGETIQAFVEEFRMIVSCHTERRYMTTTQRHLCNWIPIMVPFSTWYASPPPMGHWFYSFFPILAPITFKVYDAMSGFTCPSSYVLSKKKAKEAFPQMTDNIKYCAVFYEAQHNDARTNLSIALTAAKHGANIVNYVEMVDLIQDETGKVKGARVVDRMTGASWELRAKKVIFAGGPFTDDLRRKESSEPNPAVRGASGTHIVLPGYFCPPNMGLLDYNTSDGRFLFILPWQGHTLVGTTDKKGTAETLPNAPEDEIDWLLKECQTYLTPDLKARRSDVLSAWRGWRPLAVDPHAPSDAPVSRDHVISENPETGVIFIAGGKWTTWREMAQEVMDRVAKGTKCRTLEIPLHGAEGYSDNLPFRVIQKYGLDQKVAEHLVRTYGGRVWEVCDLMELSETCFGRRLVDGFPYLDIEVVFACREYACTIEDILSRRTRLAFLNKDAAVAAIPLVAYIMAKELGWSLSVKKQQIKAARQYVESYAGRIPKKTGKPVKEVSKESIDESDSEEAA